MQMARAATVLEPISFSALEGWRSDDHAAAFGAFSRSCEEIVEKGAGFSRPVEFGGHRADWLDVCERARQTSGPRQFFENEFVPMQVNDPVRSEGLFTGYFEPEVDGSLEAGSGFHVPVYRSPPDLVAFDAATERALGVRYGRMVNGQPQPYFSRKEIESGALGGFGLEIAWLKDWADAYFIQVQGSGRIRLPGGRTIRLAFAAKSGRPYVGIGRLLVQRGEISEDEMSMQSIRQWMAEHPRETRELMWENESFVFFREMTDLDESLGAPGAQKVPLTPGRSLAIDRNIWMFGTPVWLETETPATANRQSRQFRRLMVAQDTGTAIRGYARGDIYWGWGEEAAILAGHMKETGRMVVLLPKTLVGRLALSP
jgi:membrane-bound lytic murein transglycosylase A